MDSAVVEAPLGFVDRLAAQLVQLRRDIHRNPELSWQEQRTTAAVTDRLAGTSARLRPLTPTGLIADLGPSDARYRIGLRADLDALPLRERTGLPYASRVEGVCHACGHDVHTVALLGAGLALATESARLDDLGLGVRLIFQPAEESMPGGGRMLHGHWALSDLDQVYALHCDPGRDVGTVGLKPGPITAAGDSLTVRVSGPGGHSSRPHLTADVTFTLAKIITEVPAALSRRLDPRAGASLVWGTVHAGTVPNVIPETGEVSGTLRVLDAAVWAELEPVVVELIEQVAAPYRTSVEVSYRRGVPPVVNTPEGAAAFAAASRLALGARSVGVTQQSLGGEDFAWLLQDAPGALARLGTRTPGGPSYDLHQGDLVINEEAIRYGARLLTTLPFVVADRVGAA